MNGKLIKTWDGFSVIQNCVFRDSRLDYKELGLLVQMISLPDNWSYSIAGLAALKNSGEKSIRTGLLKLEEYGYLHREQATDSSKKFSGYNYYIYQDPASNPYYSGNIKSVKTTEKRQLEKEEEICQNAVVNNECEFNNNPESSLNSQFPPYVQNRHTVNESAKTTENFREETKEEPGRFTYAEKRHAEKRHALNDRQYNTKEYNTNNINSMLVSISNNNIEEKELLESFKKQIDFEEIKKSEEDILVKDELSEKYTSENIESVLKVLAETLASDEEFISINQNDIPKSEVIEKFKMLSARDICRVIDVVMENRLIIKKPKPFITSTAYNIAQRSFSGNSIGKILGL